MSDRSWQTRVVEAVVLLIAVVIIGRLLSPLLPLLVVLAVIVYALTAMLRGR